MSNKNNILYKKNLDLKSYNNIAINFKIAHINLFPYNTYDTLNTLFPKMHHHKHSQNINKTHVHLEHDK